MIDHASHIQADRMAPVSERQVSALGECISGRLRSIGRAFQTIGNDALGQELVDMADAVSEMVIAVGERSILEDKTGLAHDYAVMQRLFGGMQPYRFIPATHEDIS